MRIGIGLISGEMLTGVVSQFAPNVMELAVQVDSRGMTLMPTEQVAYIAFYGAGDRPRTERCERMKVHTRDRVFIVDVPPASDRLGFYAYPAETSSVFSQIYFYSHGVRAREKDVPLGAMLVESGVVEARALEAGVGAQAEIRRAPIGEILVEQGVVDTNEVATALALQARRKLRIGQILIESGLASEDAIENALAEQKRRKGKRLGEVLVEMGVIREIDLSRTLAAKFQLPFVDLDAIAIPSDVVGVLERDLVMRFGVIPIATSATTLTIAIGDPLAVDAIDAVRMAAKKRIDEVLVVPSQLRRHVLAHLSQLDAIQAQSSAAQFDALLETLQVEDLRATSEAEEELGDKEELNAEAEGGIVRIVNQVIVDAYRRGASDIHIEPNGKDDVTVIRFRVDGDCVPYQAVPGVYRNQVIARVKIMAGLDISERRKPQDGKIRFKVGDRMIELRVATIPTVNGNEDAVLRILASSKPLPLERLGFSEHNLEELQKVIRHPHGLILCVGPTGSGKTTTLHSALAALNDQTTKIWTAEDPVEITQLGLRQVQVQPKIGFTFAAAMRSFLRADPDVIMVGEMRDRETAETAIEASLTGHLVLSTLHTNSAPETVTRLLDMGLDPFSFSDSLLGVLAQRLARALCPVCRVAVVASHEDLAELGAACGGVEADFRARYDISSDAEVRLYRPKGCETCGGAGYKGRVALHELLVVDTDIRAAISRRAPAAEIRALATERGMRPLLIDGVEKVLAGVTDMKQVAAVAGM